MNCVKNVLLSNYLLLIILLLSFVEQAYAQKEKPSYIVKNDTIFFKALSDTVKYWKVNQHTFFWQIGDSIQKLQPHTNFTYWQLDLTSQIWTIPEHYRLWLTQEGLALWSYNKKIKDWKREGFVEKQALSDSVALWQIDESTSFINYKGDKKLWKADKNTVFCKDIGQLFESWILNDTTRFAKFDSLQYLQLYSDSTELWELERKPNLWKLSEATSIWTVLPNIEVWKANKRINIWSQDKRTEEWRINDTLPMFYHNPTHRLWLINNNLKVIVKEDSVQIWKRNNKNKVWNLSPDMRAWHYVPPPPPEIPKDTIDSIPPPEPEEKVKRVDLAKNQRMWQVDENTRIWEFEHRNELWRRNKNMHLWQVNDSSLIWTIDEKYRITKLDGVYKFWQKPPQQKHWIELRKLDYQRLNDTAVITKVNDELCVTKFKDKIEAWHINPNVVVSPKPQHKSWEYNDTIACWQVNDTTLLWQGTKDDPGIKWNLQDYSQLQANDSLVFWKIDAATRVSRMGDSLAVWMFENKWTVIDSVESQLLDDTTRIWKLRENLHIWQSKKSTRFWTVDKKAEVFKLRDSIRAWTYYLPPETKLKKSTSYWRFKNTVKFNTYQTQLRNWAKGGESSISLQTEGKFEAYYAKKKLKWDKWLEVKYGMQKPGEKDFRKTKDKIELDSRLNYTHNSLWAYSLHGNTKTQLAPGFNNQNLDLQISDFLAPIYINLGVGIDYSFYKVFQLYLSPITAKLTHVRDTARIDQTRYGIPKDDQTLNQTGAYVNGRLNLNLSKDIRLISRFNLFSNYFKEPENVDLDWFLEMVMKVNKFITADISLQLIYDDDIVIPIYKEVNGMRVKIGQGARLQMKEIFKIGVVFAF